MKQMSCVVHIQRTCLLFCRDCERLIHHEDQIKENISMEAKTLLKQVDNQWNVTKDSLIKQRKQVQKSIDDLEKRKAQLNLILQSRQAVDFFVKNTEIKHLLPNTGLCPVQT